MVGVFDDEGPLSLGEPLLQAVGVAFAEDGVLPAPEEERRNLSELGKAAFDELHVDRAAIAFTHRDVARPAEDGCIRAGLIEDVGRVEPLFCEVAPIGLWKNLRVTFAFPQDGKALALGIVFEAGKINECLFPDWLMGGLNGLYQISATANSYDLAR